MTRDDNITIHDPKTGETREGRRRSGAQYMKNHNLANDYIQLAIKSVTAIKAVIALLVAVSGIFWSIHTYVVLPQMEKMMEEVMKKAIEKLEARLANDEAMFSVHLLDVERRASALPNREDIKEIVGEIRVLRERQEDHLRNHKR